MKIKQILATTLVLGVLGGNIIPAYSIQNTKTSQVKLTKKQKKQMEEKQQRMDYINLPWWQDFDDEYLESYIIKAVENNNDLRIATLKVEEARQAVKIQFANELPVVAFGASPGVFKLPMSTETNMAFAMPMIANYEIDIFLKNHDKTKSVRKIYEASQYKEKAAYISIASAVGSTYYNIVKTDKMIEIQENIVKDREKIFKLMKQRNEIGITSTSDMVQYEKAYVLSQTNLVELKKARVNLLTTLAVLTGDSPENINEYKRISYDQLKKKKTIPNAISSEIIISRPDYLAAEKMIEKAGIDVRVAKKEFLPTFNITGLLAMLTTTNISPMNWENAIAGAGIMGLLPVFTGGRRIANLKIQKNRYEQAIEEYKKTNITALKEVNDSLSNLQYDTQKYDTNTKALNMEQKDYKLAQAKYKEGVISDLDLTQKREVLLTTEKLVVSENINTYISQIGLYKAVAASDL